MRPSAIAISLLIVAAFGGSSALADQRATLFVLSTGPDRTDLKPITRALENTLAQHGAKVVSPLLTPAPDEASLATLEEARSLGAAALNGFGEQIPARQLRERYESRIQKLLRLASGVRSGDGRKVLWNLCVLRTQMLLASSDTNAIREAVHQCRRLFPEQHEFSQTWLPEVIEAFARYSATLRQVTLSVRSAPAGCDVMLYGAAIGKTPLRIDVQAGAQELQLVCPDKRSSKLHQINVNEARDVVVRLDADAASNQSADIVRLVYASSAAATEALDHASALANEAESDTFFMISEVANAVRVSRHQVDGQEIDSRRVRPQASEKEITAAALELLKARAPKAPTKTNLIATPRRTWQDATIGSGLLLAGVATAAYALSATVRDGECANDDCSRVHTADTGTQAILFSAAGVLAASGLTVIWRAPFRRKVDVQAGLRGLQVRGSF